MRRTNLFKKTLMPGKIEGRRKRGQQRMRWLDGITNSMDINSRSWCWTGRPDMLQSMGLRSLTRLSDWTELNWTIFFMVQLSYLFVTTGKTITLTIWTLVDKWLIIFNYWILNECLGDQWTVKNIAPRMRKKLPHIYNGSRMSGSEINEA